VAESMKIEMLRRVVWQKFTAVSELLTTSVVRVMHVGKLSWNPKDRKSVPNGFNVLNRLIIYLSFTFFLSNLRLLLCTCKVRAQEKHKLS
jgi:hypothetical protein